MCVTRIHWTSKLKAFSFSIRHYQGLLPTSSSSSSRTLSFFVLVSCYVYACSQCAHIHWLNLFEWVLTTICIAAKTIYATVKWINLHWRNKKRRNSKRNPFNHLLWFVIGAQRKTHITQCYGINIHIARMYIKNRSFSTTTTTSNNSKKSTLNTYKYVQWMPYNLFNVHTAKHPIPWTLRKNQIFCETAFEFVKNIYKTNRMLFSSWVYGIEQHFDLISIFKVCYVCLCMQKNLSAL